MSRFAFCALFAAWAFAATPPPYHSSFDGSADRWTAIHGISTVDATVQHNGRKSLRVEPGSGAQDASVRSAPISLTIGKRYELSGWVRTSGIEVRDTDRSPIATGAALTMSSMPFDVHSTSVGGTHDWTRLSLSFIATRAEDNILLTVGNGGAFRGKAWFEGVSIDDASNQGAWPVAEAVTRYGPAYRYPYGGWIYLHIEGKPYERGYQHGHLMAKEIPEYIERCMADLGFKDAEGWRQARMSADALFLRGFDDEILQEMKGIADGAADAGAKFQGRKVDLLDIVTANITVELGELRSALPMTPTGLEGLHLARPEYKHTPDPNDHCSAFAATGKATRDGKMIIAHLTMWPLTLAEQTNVMLDIKPEKGHRVLIQSYPGGIESGTDWYQNDAGVVLTETTIRQSPFNAQGTPVAFRARKAIQYGDNIDKVVEILAERNNGLYTNEWLIGDAKNNEIAMFELGTYKTKLWRSSKNEWFGGTEGFYWGDNNAKDLNVRLEYKPDPQGQSEFVPYVPESRDLKWLEMYEKYKGNIDEQFAFLAMRTPPLVSSSTMDAKITNTDMASRMMVWAAIGKPNQTAWVADGWGRKSYAKNDGLFPSGYRLFTAEPPPAGAAAVTKAEPEKPEPHKVSSKDLWKGWVLPASASDEWFVSGTASYYRDLKSDDLDDRIQAHWAAYRRVQLEEQNDRTRHELETHKGVIFLDSLRTKLGDEKFFKLMRDYFDAHTTQHVTAQSFLDAAEVKFAMPPEQGSAIYVAADIYRRLDSLLIVYGTGADAGANRYAAEQLRKEYFDWYQSEIPIRKDFELTDDELKGHDVIFVGRPEGNSALASIASKIGLDYSAAMFRVNGKPQAYERAALVLAAPNPLDKHRMVLVMAGNDALDTVKLAGQELPATQYAIFEDAKESTSGFIR